MKIEIELKEQDVIDAAVQLIAKDLKEHSKMSYSEYQRDLKKVKTETIKEIIYENKDELIEKIVEQAKTELVRKALPRLIEKF